MKAFLKKEYLDHFRTGKLLILVILFFFFGVMNPATAKLTPLLLEIFADSLEGSGIIITGVEVTALDSWMQFYKNAPLFLIAFILLESNIFTKEYSSKTLVLSLTKGLKRYKVVASKSIMLISLWNVCYWLSFAITYLYNAYFWDNSIAVNLVFSAICWWIFGLWTITLVVFFSVVANQQTTVLLGTGGIIAATYLLGFIPKIDKYFPTKLIDGTSLVYKMSDTGSYISAIAITITLCIVLLAISIPIFNKKEI